MRVIPSLGATRKLTEPTASVSTSLLCALYVCSWVPMRASQNLTLPIESAETMVESAAMPTAQTTVCSPLRRSTVILCVCVHGVPASVGASNRLIVESEQPATR